MKKVLLQTVLAASVALTVLPSASVFAASPATAVVSAVNHSNGADSIEGFIQFLDNKYGIRFGDEPTRGDFIEAVAKVLPTIETATEGDSPVFTDVASSDPLYSSAVKLYKAGILTTNTIHADAKLTPLSALYIAVKAAGIQELSYTYPSKKVEASLNTLGLSPSRVQGKAASEIAAAVDTGLLPSSLYKETVQSKQASSEYAATLLGQVLELNGNYKHSIGKSSDADIYSKLYDAYITSDLIPAPDLRKIVNQALENNEVTGYNLKDKRFDSNFIDSLKLTYGHDDIKHAKQLIGLLRSEGIEADIQLQPKTSAFIYLKEWGEPKETENYKVEQIANGNYIAYAKEYDLDFEFNNTDDKHRFNDVVLAYAKKNSDEQKDLLYGSWWQPLYYSTTALPNYKVIVNNKITKGNYYAQSFTLKENAAKVSAVFKKLAPDADVSSYKLWVDVPFYNYLQGGFE
ncbi:hypothetical protein [Paenibacillus sp. Marseille-Q4541]|uniref:hypothetical protein n=1 Tax=Paenibacillus sp. Marseille-Q4541 TaxID=2831522 RepID=UPI001BAC43A1|nr:hypothetical protein [Paenibacillus sp. Marseille-Q4541]